MYLRLLLLLLTTDCITHVAWSRIRLEGDGDGEGRKEALLQYYWINSICRETLKDPCNVRLHLGCLCLHGTFPEFNIEAKRRLSKN